MASDLTRGRGDDYLKIEQKAKEKFESLDLTNVIREIYFSSIKKASEDYKIEIENNRKYFLETSYTEEQAQERFNDYTEGIRIQNEEDDCFYRYIKNNFITENPDATTEGLQECIINAFSIYLKSDDLSYTNKLNYLEELPQQIYESNKIHRQFLFFKNFAEKHMSKSTNKNNANRTDIAYCIYYLCETKSLELNSIFPSDKAWKEIGENYNKNSKNIQQIYNLISHKRDERLKKSKRKNIKYVINNMLEGKEEALKLAKDELKLAQLNS